MIERKADDTGNSGEAGLKGNPDFQCIWNRRDTNALALEGYKEYLFGENGTEILKKEDELIPMWVADMEFSAPPSAVDNIAERLKHPIFGYTMNFNDEFYGVFEKWCRDHHKWSFKREELNISHGVIPALYFLVEHLCPKPEDKVVTLAPCYAFFKKAAEHHKRDLVLSDLLETNSGYKIDFKDLERKLSDENVKVFILCHPHNPSGQSWCNEDLVHIGELCTDHGVHIISDEIHCDLGRTGKIHTPLSKLLPHNTNITTCMAVSKTFNLAGLMFASIIIKDEELRRQWKENYYPFINPLSLAAAIGAYRGGADWLRELKLVLDENFEHVSSFLALHLPKARFLKPEFTYFAWLDLGEYFPDNVNMTKFFVENAGLIVEGSEMFVQNGGKHIRLNIACPKSRLHSALKSIVGALNKN